MVVLDATIVNIALPQMQQALGFSPTGLSWVLNAYTLTFGGLLLLGGRAGESSAAAGCSSPASCCSRSPRSSAACPARPAAAGRPRPAGCRRGHRRTHRAGAADHELRGRPGAQSRVRGIRRRLRRRRGRRPARRGDAHPVAVVALDAVRQRPDRHRGGRARAPVHPRVRAAPGRFDLAGALTSTVGMAALVYGFISAAWTAGATPSPSARSRRRRLAGHVPLIENRTSSRSRRCTCSPTATAPAATW